MLFGSKTFIQIMTFLAVFTIVVVAFAEYTPPKRVLVVASPRAALVPQREDYSTGIESVGAVCNFPTHPIFIIVRQGTLVTFRDSKNLEGVWYPRTFGILATRLKIQKHVRDEDGKSKWVTLGADGARGIRRGPSIGTADIKVNHQFRKVGIHLLRAVVETTAKPLHPDTDKEIALGPEAKALKVIPILVSVVPYVDSDDQVKEHIPLDPDAEATVPMEKITE